MVSRRLLLALLVLRAFATLADTPDARLVREFAAVLVKDDIGGIPALAPESVDTLSAWTFANEIIDRYDCIEVQSVAAEVVRADDSERLLRVVLRGTGVTTGALRLTEPLANVWYLKLVRTPSGWRIGRVTTAEQKLANAIIVAGSDAERRALIDMRADLGKLAAILAYDSAEVSHGERGFELIRFAREIGEFTGRADRIEYTRQMESALHSMLGRTEEATRTAMEALESAVRSGDGEAITLAAFTVAVAYWSSDDIPSAIAYFRRSADQAETIADPRRAIMALVNLCHLAQSRFDLSGALADAHEVERLSKTYGYRQGELDALIIQSGLYHRLGNFVVAEQTARKALALAVALRRSNHIEMATLALGETALARGAVDEALARFGGMQGSASRLGLARALVAKGLRNEAAAMYEKAAADPDHGVAAEAKLALAYLTLGSDPARALQLVHSAAELLPKIGTSGSRSFVHAWEPKAAEGAVLLALGRSAEAAQALEQSIAAIEAERGSLEMAATTHASFFTRCTGPYHDLIDLHVRDGRAADALRVSERLKGTLLDEIHSRERADVGARMTNGERAEQQRIVANIERINGELFRARFDARAAERVKSELAEARAQWERFETALHARYGLQRTTRPPSDPLQSPQLLLTTPQEVVLDFVVLPKKTILFVLSRGEGSELTIDMHAIPAGDRDLERDVDRLLGRIGSGSFDYQSEARRLYRLLVAPAAARLSGSRLVGIVADGPLWRLPFQALLGDDGRPLVSRFALFYAPSLASLLRASEGSRPAPASVLAIGNPRFGEDVAERMRARTRATLGDLPDAAVEARQVAALYDRGRSHLLTGREATEAAIKAQAPRHDVLHIAAHAISDDTQPLYSGIVLARDASEDGLLEGREITRLGLHARLAVLSACSTAQGQVRPGEGLIGLSWAFLVAGCPTIVATQWSVPSVSTSKLMVDFHRELARGGVSVAEALRRAQLRLMKDRRYRHPFYWSAFVVVGAGRS